MKSRLEETRRAPNGAAGCAIVAIVVLFAAEGIANGGNNSDTDMFHLTDVSGYVELGFFTDLNERSRSSSRNSNLERIEFSETLDIDIDAYIYHPWFLSLNGGLNVETIQDVGDSGSNRTLVGGDLRLDFLRQKPNSFAVFAKVVQSQIVRPFTQSYDLTDQVYGATFYRTSGWVPFTLSYAHHIQDGGIDGNLDEIDDTVDFFGQYELNERSTGRIDYGLSFEEVLGERSRRQQVNVTNQSYFGEKLQNRLAANLLFTEQDHSGQLYRTAANVDYDWQHTENLSTGYTLDFRREDAESQTVNNLSPTFRIRHQLYESLTSQLELFARIQDASFSQRDEYGGLLTENYIKKLGEWGTLGLTVSPRILMTSTRPEQDTALAINEVHVMRLAQPVLLRNLDVITGTIVVTNQSESLIYQEGVDYQVISVGDGIQTELALTIPSQIADGETVLVDYEYRLMGDSDILTPSVNILGSLWLFDHLKLFGQYEIDEPKVLSGDEAELRINSFDRSVIGFQVDWPWVSATAQYENYDATIGPFESASGMVSVFTYGAHPWQARARAGYGYQSYTGSDDNVSRATLAANASLRLLRRGLLEFEANWLRERWSGSSASSNDLDQIFVGTEFSWWYGQFQLELETGIAQLLRRTEDKSVYQVDFRLRRSF
jgi:hypothetical protein